MGTLIGWIILKTGWSEKIARLVAVGGFVLLVLAVLGGVVAYIRHDAVSDHQVAVERRAAPANDQAATERANDTITETRSEEEMHNVIAAAPDQPIAPTSRAHACEQLRRAGRDPPACR